ncbi:unnamed protein product [Periconia digitata]|uniref:Uncharacterized protein n=1 Tax=Periconia digitata TaxID=1303443 RepID=A0A9W4XR21_9PLEO|nr:unnamed protein product [Periconia digitata]
MKLPLPRSPPSVNALLRRLFSIHRPHGTHDRMQHLPTLHQRNTPNPHNTHPPTTPVEHARPVAKPVCTHGILRKVSTDQKTKNADPSLSTNVSVVVASSSSPSDPTTQQQQQQTKQTHHHHTNPIRQKQPANTALPRASPPTYFYPQILKPPQEEEEGEGKRIFSSKSNQRVSCSFSSSLSTTTTGVAETLPSSSDRRKANAIADDCAAEQTRNTETSKNSESSSSSAIACRAKRLLPSDYNPAGNLFTERSRTREFALNGDTAGGELSRCSFSSSCASLVSASGVSESPPREVLRNKLHHCDDNDDDYHDFEDCVHTHIPHRHLRYVQHRRRTGYGVDPPLPLPIYVERYSNLGPLARTATGMASSVSLSPSPSSSSSLSSLGPSFPEFPSVLWGFVLFGLGVGVMWTLILCAMAFLYQPTGWRDVNASSRVEGDRADKKRMRWGWPRGPSYWWRRIRGRWWRGASTDEEDVRERRRYSLPRLALGGERNGYGADTVEMRTFDQCNRSDPPLRTQRVHNVPPAEAMKADTAVSSATPYSHGPTQFAMNAANEVPSTSLLRRRGALQQNNLQNQQTVYVGPNYLVLPGNGERDGNPARAWDPASAENEDVGPPRQRGSLNNGEGSTSSSRRPWVPSFSAPLARPPSTAWSPDHAQTSQPRRAWSDGSGDRTEKSAQRQHWSDGSGSSRMQSSLNMHPQKSTDPGFTPDFSSSSSSSSSSSPSDPEATSGGSQTRQRSSSSPQNPFLPPREMLRPRSSEEYLRAYTAFFSPTATATTAAMPSTSHRQSQQPKMSSSLDLSSQSSSSSSSSSSPAAADGDPNIPHILNNSTTVAAPSAADSGFHDLEAQLTHPPPQRHHHRSRRNHLHAKSASMLKLGLGRGKKTEEATSRENNVVTGSELEGQSPLHTPNGSGPAMPRIWSGTGILEAVDGAVTWGVDKMVKWTEQGSGDEGLLLPLRD